jgi:ATP adenylyltransferase
MTTDCPFCDCPDLTHRLDLVAALLDRYPVAEGHHLVIPLRHTPDFFSMTFYEIDQAIVLLGIIRQELLEDDPTIAGFNIGMNCGEAAGQTVAHAHIHLIPRRVGDTPVVRGGVRCVIPGRMD